MGMLLHLSYSTWQLIVAVDRFEELDKSVM